MRSCSLNHFPQIRQRNGERLLWNPLVKKAFRNLPEERVRLQTLEFLLHEAGWSPFRISSETAIRNRGHADGTVRADMICYDQDFNPALIIECKAPEIRLTEKTALQIAGYNRTIKAPYLLLTNGVMDACFELDEHSGSAKSIEPARIFGTREVPDYRTLTYFNERGFSGVRSSLPVKDWLTQALPEFWKRPAEPDGTMYLDLGKTADGEPVNHYYRIFPVQEGKKLALTFTAARSGDTCIIAVLNEKGVNSGLLEINLERILQNEPYPAVFYHSNGKKKMDVPGFPDLLNYDQEQILTLSERIIGKLSNI
ncbi:MAG: type I restriction enzyme HsdR N-terminal domain-containing protein [Balneolales bacterium]